MSIYSFSVEFIHLISSKCLSALARLFSSLFVLAEFPWTDAVFSLPQKLVISAGRDVTAELSAFQ